jgi:hypothetical protein
LSHIPENLRPIGKDYRYLPALLLLLAVRWAAKPFKGAKATFIPLLLSIMREFVTVGVKLCRVQQFLSTSLTAFTWAILHKYSCQKGFSRGPSGELHGAFLQKLKWLKSREQWHQGIDKDTIIHYHCPTAIGALRLTLKTKKVSDDNDLLLSSDEDLLSSGDEQAIIKEPPT